MRRPRRKMPSTWAVASYWHARGLFEIDPYEPACFACGMDPSPDGAYSLGMRPRERWLGVGGHLHRAHLVDRTKDGLDGVQNLALLCDTCHHFMPSFADGRAAIGWVQAGSPLFRIAKHIVAKAVPSVAATTTAS